MYLLKNSFLQQSFLNQDSFLNQTFLNWDSTVFSYLCQFLCSNVSKTISDIVIKLLAKTAENRYQGSSGLTADVEKCYAQLKESGKIEEFAVGSFDIPEQFQIPEKLYGREKEIEHFHVGEIKKE